MSAAPTSAQLATVLISDYGAVPESAEMLASMVLDHVCYGDDGASVVDRFGVQAMAASGAPMTVVDLIEQHRIAYPPLFSARPSASASAEPPRPTGFRTPPSRDQAQSNTIERLLDQCPNRNPYRGSGNSTAVALLERHDPTRASRLRAEAGK